MVEETSPSLDGGRILHLEILDGEMGFLEADGLNTCNVSIISSRDEKCYA